MSHYVLQNCVLLFTLLLWWTGIGGRDLYAIPALIWLGMWAWFIHQERFTSHFQQHVSHFLQWRKKNSFQHIILWLFGFHAVLLLLFTLLKYYSFRWNIWDVGIYSNILYNIAQGEFYTSYYQIHSWADHFTPSMSFLGLFYALTPSTHWLTFSKVIAFILTPYAMFQVCRQEFKEEHFVWGVTLLLSIAWFFLYAPILNSLYFEYHPSALAAPLIFYAFLCFRQEHWIRFWICLLFLAGLKEHTASIWIGFGCYLLLNSSHKKTGAFLITSGTALIYIIIFQVMPYFRDYLPAWTFVMGPFESLDQKFIYVFKLLLPLGFLPIIYWRYGILAAPAIGVNLMAGTAKPAMYSSHYHYDDLSVPLLFLSLILVFKYWEEEKRFSTLLNSKWQQSYLLVSCVGILALLPASPMRKFWEAIPNTTHWKIHKELQEFDMYSKGKSLSLQAGLGPHIHRREIRAIKSTPVTHCGSEDSDYYILARGVSSYSIFDFEACIKDLSQNSDYKRLDSYQNLIVFEKKMRQ